MQLEIIVPVLMSAALLLWVGQGMSWSRKLTVAAATLVVIVVVVVIERSGVFR